MRARALLAAALVATSLSGCLDFLDPGLDHPVSRTPIDTVGWNTGGVMSVHVRTEQAYPVVITATATTGRVERAEGLSSEELGPVQLAIPDGTWTVKYSVDGEAYETFKGARFDSTAPRIAGLDTVGDAEAGSYTLGAGATVDGGASLQVLDQATGRVVATSLPTTINGLTPSIACGGAAGCIRAYDVVVTDAAGNEAAEQVQVRIGDAQRLPDGEQTLGLVARYTLEALVWDIHDLGTWMTPEQAQRAAGSGNWLGSGRGIEPGHPAVVAVKDEVVAADMTVGEAAFALFRWMADELEYDTGRLESRTLLRPHQVILDQEDASAAADADPDEDGLVPDGAGNGVRGGVCRDLAALYVSLLRAAGIPARLVTGYLGGQVDGFHAWVEFYGGDGHGPAPWVPVDVSGIGSTSEIGEQRYEPSLALQAFGLRHTDMLPLRIVTEAQEDGSWSTAVALSTSYPRDDPPEVDLGKLRTKQFTVPGALCVNLETLERKVVSDPDGKGCSSSFLRDFTRSASYILDYGAKVTSASSGTTVTVTLSYPEPAAVAPGVVEQVTYCSPASKCAPFSKDAGRGVTVGTWSA